MDFLHLNLDIPNSSILTESEEEVYSRLSR